MKKLIYIVLVITFLTVSTSSTLANSEMGAVYRNLLKRYCDNYSGHRVVEIYADIEVFWGGTLQGREVIPDNWELTMNCYDVYYENGFWIN